MKLVHIQNQAGIVTQVDAETLDFTANNYMNLGTKINVTSVEEMQEGTIYKAITKVKGNGTMVHIQNQAGIVTQVDADTLDFTSNNYMNLGTKINVTSKEEMQEGTIYKAITKVKGNGTMVHIQNQAGIVTQVDADTLDFTSNNYMNLGTKINVTSKEEMQEGTIYKAITKVKGNN